LIFLACGLVAKTLVYATLDRRAVTGVRAVGDVALTGDIGTITSHGT